MPRAKISPWISNSAYNLLKKIQASEDQELVYERGAGWWVDTTQINSRITKELLMTCLIHLDNGETGRYEVYTLNEDGN